MLSLTSLDKVGDSSPRLRLPASSRRLSWLIALAAVACLSSAAHAQTRPYIGFVYPAGGQQGKTVEELDAQWDDPDYWTSKYQGWQALDERIREFNERVGLLGKYR